MLVKYSYVLGLSPDKHLGSHYASFPSNASLEFIEDSLRQLCTTVGDSFVDFEVVTDNLIVF